MTLSRLLLMLPAGLPLVRHCWLWVLADWHGDTHSIEASEIKLYSIVTHIGGLSMAACAWAMSVAKYMIEAVHSAPSGKAYL